MKHIQIILGLILFTSVSTFAQSPRIKLNQITKDTVKGSVLISSASDSGMVYSRDFYIAYGADTLLILYGDTIGGVGGGVNSIVVDTITLNGNGTTASPLSVDTATISTIQGLVDSLSNYVTTNTSQTISGAKTFTAALTQSGGDANFDSGTLFVDESANEVGIGTTSPGSTLDITVPNNTPSAAKLLAINQSGGTGFFSISDGASGSNFTPTFSGKTGSTFKEVGLIYVAYVDSINDFASGGLHYASIEFSGRRLMPDGSSEKLVNSDVMAVNNYTTNLFKIQANGNAGIGTTGPSEKLDVNGNARFRSIGSGASSGALHYTSTGVLTTNTSDVRLKTNLQPLENTLNKLLGINTYTFNWIDETDRVDLGMVAQEVEQIFPNLVFTNSVDGYKGIHYDKFSSILTKAIQEQQAIIDTQEQKITDLETTIQSLITRIKNLENK